MNFSIKKIKGQVVEFSASSPGIDGEVKIVLQDYNIDQGIYNYGISGQLIDGRLLSGKTISVPSSEVPELTTEPINPEKVFWWIADKLKDYLCPDCLN